MQFFKVDLKNIQIHLLKNLTDFYQLSSLRSQTYRGIPLRNERICLSRTANLHGYSSRICKNGVRNRLKNVSREETAVKRTEELSN